MTRPICTATKTNGEPCRGMVRPGRPYCAFHDPELDELRNIGRAEGGYNRRTERRAYKRMPQGVKGALSVLERTLGALESGDMEPARGQAIAAVARAVVVAFESASLSDRLDALEAKVNSPDTPIREIRKGAA